jgi:hypothetical protein
MQLTPVTEKETTRHQGSAMRQYQLTLIVHLGRLRHNGYLIWERVDMLNQVYYVFKHVNAYIMAKQIDDMRTV